LSELTEETSGLVRREVQAARSELLDRLTANGPAVALLGTSAALGILCLASSHRFLLSLLEKRLSPSTAALVAGLGYGVAAGATGVVGADRLRRAPTPLPVDTARDIRQAVGDAASGV
jgi:hypothetical protein